MVFCNWLFILYDPINILFHSKPKPIGKGEVHLSDLEEFEQLLLANVDVVQHFGIDQILNLLLFDN